MIRRYGAANWQGKLRDGKGRVSTETGVLSDQPYAFSNRFENEPGTNPEELIGAAHASCFAMALSLNLEQAGLVAENIDAKSTVSLEQVEGGFAITRVHAEVTARVPGAREEQFRQAVEATRTGCPVGKALAVEITTEARLA